MPQDIADVLPGLFRQAEAGPVASALVPWFCDALPSPKSRREYLSDLKAFTSHMREQGVEPLSVTGDHVRLYKEAMREAGLKPGTISRRLSCLRGTYQQFGKSIW